MQLIDDKEMYHYVLGAKRGGVSSVQKRFDCTKHGYDIIKTIDKEFITALNKNRSDCPEAILYIGKLIIKTLLVQLIVIFQTFSYILFYFRFNESLW